MGIADKNKSEVLMPIRELLEVFLGLWRDRQLALGGVTPFATNITVVETIAYAYTSTS